MRPHVITNDTTHTCPRCENDTRVTVTDGECSTQECRVCHAALTDADFRNLAEQIIEQNRDACEAAKDREENWARERVYGS